MLVPRAPGAPRRVRPPPTYLKADERDALLAVTDDVRDRAILTVFLYAGLRLNELCMLDRGDLDFRGRTLLVRFAKRGKWRQVRLHPLAAAAVADYLATRTDDDPALFRSQERRRIARRTVQGMLDRYTARLDLGKRVTPHCLRHTFATALLRSCRDLRVVQRALGHADVKTTVIYTQLEDDELFEAMDGL